MMELLAHAEPIRNTLRTSRLSRLIPADLMAFRHRVKELIREAGSEVALERRAELPTGTLSHYSRSQPSEPSRPYLVAIATAMDVHLDWLCAGRGPKRGLAFDYWIPSTTPPESPEEER
jgi:hypothetical protein